MYLSSTLSQLYRALRARAAERPGGARVPANVYRLGVTSLVTDISSEMIAVVLPLYARYALDLSPAAIGALDGAHHAAEAIGRVVMGAIADRTRRLKEMALVGYVLSLVSRALLAVGGIASGSAALVAAIAIDRSGKGLRAAPRDAMIALDAAPEIRATAFAVHRALDTLGSVLGPVAVWVLLTLVPLGFDVVFVASAGIALVGVLYFALLVQPVPAAPARPESTARAAPVEPAGPVGGAVEGASGWTAPGGLRRFAVLVTIGGLVSLSEINPSLLFVVTASRARLSVADVGVLHLANALTCAALVIPLGRLADRIGRWRVLVLGQLALAGAYAWSLGVQAGLAGGVGGAALLGTHYAATEGVLVAMASAALPRERLATGLAVLAGVGLVAKVGASIAFGALWGDHGTGTALAVACGAAALAVVAVVLGARRDT